MAKYLDETGLGLVWGKIKAKFISQPTTSVTAGHIAKFTVTDTGDSTIIGLEDGGAANNHTHSVVSSTAAGFAPTLPASTATPSAISTVATEWVLTTTSGATPTWKKLPAEAFQNNTYDVYNSTFQVQENGGTAKNTLFTANVSANKVGLNFINGTHTTATVVAASGSTPASVKFSHNSPGTGTDLAATNTDTTTYTDGTTYDVVTGVTITKDNLGHVTGLKETRQRVKSSIATPASPGAGAFYVVANSATTGIDTGFTANSSNNTIGLNFINGNNTTAAVTAVSGKAPTITFNHNSGSAAAVTDGTASEYAKDTMYTVLTGISYTVDDYGHITGISTTRQKIKDTNTTYTRNVSRTSAAVTAGTIPVWSANASGSSASASLKDGYTVDSETLSSSSSAIPTSAAVSAAISGLSGAMHFVGTTTSTMTDGQTTNPTVSEVSSFSSGDVVVDATETEFVLGNEATPKWHKLGDANSYALNSVTVTGTGVLEGGGAISSNLTITHKTSGVTSGTYGPSQTSTVSGTNGTTVNIPKITVNEYGHVTSVENIEYSSVDHTYTSLKNPNAIKIGGNETANQISYDGSASGYQLILTGTGVSLSKSNNVVTATITNSTYTVGSKLLKLSDGTNTKTAIGVNESSSDRTVTFSGDTWVTPTVGGNDNAATVSFAHGGPGTGTDLAATNTDTTTYTDGGEYTVVTGVTITKDSKGHVTGLKETRQKIKSSIATPASPGAGVLQVVANNGTSGIATPFTANIGSNTIGLNFINGTHTTAVVTAVSGKAPTITFNHDAAGTGSAMATTNGDAAAATAGTSYDVLTGVTISKDSLGHITGVSTTRQKVVSNSTYSLPVAKYNTLGGVKPAYSSTGAATLTTAAATNTTTPTIAAKTTTSGRYYALEVDKNGVAFTNVPWTDASVTSSDNHYTPSGTTAFSATAGSSPVGWSGAVVTGLTTDGKGHITGLTTNTIPANPNVTTAAFVAGSNSATAATAAGTSIANGSLYYIIREGSTNTATLITGAGATTVTKGTDATNKIVITSTDTKNTAGSSDTSSKIFLIGATSQSSTGVTTYSHDTAYVGTDGCLYSNNGLGVGTKVMVVGDVQELTADDINTICV